MEDTVPGVRPEVVLGEGHSVEAVVSVVVVAAPAGKKKEVQ